MGNVNKMLNRAMADVGMTTQDLAEKVGSDPRTVERWRADSTRTPQPRLRAAAADILGMDETMLWPNAARNAIKTGPDREVVAVYPTRFSIPTDVYRRMFTAARTEIALCATSYYGLFNRLPDLSDILRDRAEAGCRVRVIVGDPTSPVIQRANDIRHQHEPMSWADTIGYTLTRLEPLRDVVEVRQTDMAWGRSVYRLDGDAMVCLYVAGPETTFPYLHLRRRQVDGIFDQLAVRHVDGVWEAAQPLS